MGCELIGWCSLDVAAQAAWAQAILTVVAVLLAAWMAGRARKQDLLRQLNLFVGLLAMVADQANADLRSMSKRSGTFGDDPGYRAGDWDELIRILQEIPRHELPDHRLVMVLHDAKVAAEMFRDAYRGATEAVLLRSAPAMSELINALVKSSRAIVAQYNEALAVYESHVGFAPFHWAKLKARYWYVISIHELNKRISARSN